MKVIRHITIFVYFIFAVFGAKGQKRIAIAEANKDVFILASIIREHMRETKSDWLKLRELVQKDSLKRITNSFEKLEVVRRGGYIGVYYKFSSLRDNSKIELSEIETKRSSVRKWRRRKISKECDGQIRFEYGERHYFINKFVVNKHMH